MKKILLILLFPSFLMAQEIIELPITVTNEAIKWTEEQSESYGKFWQTQVVANVAKPTMEVFLPKQDVANGTAVIIAPGGGMYGLSIESEGRQVARWLNEKGIAAFVLKYRLVPTEGDATEYISKDGPNVEKKAMEVLPMASSDGLHAIEHVRENAAKYKVNPAKIGFMGFSAGGAVTMAVNFGAGKYNAPNFIVPVYAWMNVIPSYEVKKDSPPMLVICAADDPLGLAPASIKLYEDWFAKELLTELHMYSKGGHGFGMKTQNLASDKWIERFYDWALTEGFVK
jgi:dienelactone hydrolase